ncbi:hypothetical protein [Aliarcobacter butzleri]|uniref:hypothetical protein n=1 Tax=Aliarcobacter butzleri TaxID=28197 RepID=UPI00125ECCEB|nr:hypothetical protein [Aliarcobacter butzleri]
MERENNERKLMLKGADLRGLIKYIPIYILVPLAIMVDIVMEPPLNYAFSSNLVIYNFDQVVYFLICGFGMSLYLLLKKQNNKE